MIVTSKKLERQTTTVRFLNDASARIRIRSTTNHTTKTFQIKRIHAFGERHVHAHVQRNTQFVQFEQRVGCNHRTSRKVDTFAHEIPTDATLLRFQTLAYRLQGSSTALLRLIHTTFIVNERRK